jgi:predicted transposase/invertase (TIGR01784 family)
MKFVDVTNDIAFRRIFGNENKTKILISFLNAILKFEGGERIVEVEIINPYQLPRIAGEKASIIDVRAKDERGRQFVVEMQVASAKGFSKRVQYYAARDYSMQINSGDKYHLLKPTFLIGILDFKHFNSDNYLSNHATLDEETYENVLDDIKYTFIELPKFNLKVTELKTLIEKWIFFIKEAENLAIIPENTDDEGLIEAYEDADKHSWGKEELIAYDNFFIAKRDAIGRLELAKERAEEIGLEIGLEIGMKQGLEKGLEQGKLSEKEEVAKRCLENGMSIEITAQISELTIEEIEKMKE